MKRPVLVVAFLAALLLPRSAQATLIDRGDGLIYDTVLDITWVQDANLCVALGNCVNSISGLMTWADASTWAANLDYQGFTDWRLPSMDVNGDMAVVTCSTGVDCPDNEYGHMYYQNLNGVLGENKQGSQVGDGGVTLNNINFAYWSSTEGSQFPGTAFDFFFVNASQGPASQSDGLFAWAVRSGDVASVPEPGSAVLFGGALVGLGLARRWRHR